jgi:hypothetical protein
MSERTGVLVLTVAPHTDYQQVADGRWRVVDLHHAADDHRTASEAEAARGMLLAAGIETVAITPDGVDDLGRIDFDALGLDAELLADCVRWWDVAPDEAVEVWVPEDAVADTLGELARVGLHRAQVHGQPDVKRYAPLAPRSTLLVIAADALLMPVPDGHYEATDAWTAQPDELDDRVGLVEALVLHQTGGWAHPMPGVRALQTWRERLARLHGVVDPRTTFVVGDGSPRARCAVSRVLSATPRTSGHGSVHLRDDWGPSELAAGVAHGITKLGWTPQRAVVVIREDEHFEDALRSAWLGSPRLPDEVTFIRADRTLGVLEAHIIAAGGGGDPAELLALLDEHERGASEPL